MLGDFNLMFNEFFCLMGPWETYPWNRAASVEINRATTGVIVVKVEDKIELRVLPFHLNQGLRNTVSSGVLDVRRFVKTILEELKKNPDGFYPAPFLVFQLNSDKTSDASVCLKTIIELYLGEDFQLNDDSEPDNKFGLLDIVQIGDQIAILVKHDDVEQAKENVKSLFKYIRGILIQLITYNKNKFRELCSAEINDVGELELCVTNDNADIINHLYWSNVCEFKTMVDIFTNLRPDFSSSIKEILENRFLSSAPCVRNFVFENYEKNDSVPAQLLKK